MATGGIYAISVTADRRYKTIIARLQKEGPLGVERAANETVFRMRKIIINVLQIQFQNAYLRSPGAFPIAYLIQLTSAVEVLPVQVEHKGYTFTIAFNLGDLGDESELEHGYHYGAQLASGGTVTLPYGRANLKNDIEVRYAFWQALRYSLLFRGRPLSDDLWNNTISARVSYWSSINKAPQWLLLQYGQSTYAPTNEPFPIVENTRELIKKLANGIFANELIKEYNKMRRSMGQEVVYPKALIERSTFLVGSPETDYLSTGEADAKTLKMPALVKAHTIAAINAKSNTEILDMITRLSSLEGTELDLFIKNWGGP